MNIFYLDHNPRKSARYLCDRHCVKMVLESAQMLCTAHRVLGTDSVADHYGLYKSTHIRHPCSVWTRESTGNYKWHYRLFLAMLDEYSIRYNRTHACDRLTIPLSGPPQRIPNAKFTIPPQCMPDEYKGIDTVQAYRRYYIHGKSDIAVWKFCPSPLWFKQK